jgi:hypothetical protein
MDSNQYYHSLMQQGYSSADAIHFTQQYYPNFDGPSQVMAMMTPPPPGSMEMGGMVTGGIGTSAAGVVAAGGGMSVATIAVVSVLVLGGVGTGGYFLYDYLTEPDFYGETYWTEDGMGVIFEENKIVYVLLADSYYEEFCDYFEDMGDGEYSSEYKKDGCYVTLTLSNDAEEKGDYYKICVPEGDDEECIKVYPSDGGAVIKDSDGGCDVLVSDIRNPDFDYDDEVSEDWQDDFQDKAADIEDDGPSNCDYDKLDYQ